MTRVRDGALHVQVPEPKTAAAFYQKGFSFTKPGIMSGLDGKPVTSRIDTSKRNLMLGPEMLECGGIAVQHREF